MKNKYIVPHIEMLIVQPRDVITLSGFDEEKYDGSNSVSYSAFLN